MNSKRIPSGYNPENLHLEPRVASLEANIASISRDVGELTKIVQLQGQQFNAGLANLSDKLSTSVTPNMQTMAAWAIVVLTVVGMVAAPLGWHFEQKVAELDIKLQKEFTLALETQRNGLDNAMELSRRSLARIERLEEWNSDRIAADLEELRQRRMGNHP